MVLSNLEFIFLLKTRPLKSFQLNDFSNSIFQLAFSGNNWEQKIAYIFLVVENLKKDGPSEHKKCLCKHRECTWAQKSQKCQITTNDGGAGATSGAPSGGHSGSISNLTSGLDGLRSIMRELTLTNNGNINVNFNLRWYDQYYVMTVT